MNMPFIKQEYNSPFEKFTLKLLTGQRYEARGWFGGARPAPARVYEEPRQRGFFARLTR